MKYKEILIVFGVILGILIVSQGKVLFEVKETLSRDSSANIFQEIKIMKDKNKELSKEVQFLTNNLEKLSDQDSAIDAIKEDIESFKKTSGHYLIFGSGIKIIVGSEVHPSFIVDIINELFNSGANAVAINGIRITNSASGVDMMPNGQLFIGSYILSRPYKITAIGDYKTMNDLILSSGGFVDRAKNHNPNLEIIVQSRDIIQM